MDATATLAVAILVAALAGTVYLVVSSRGRRAITTPEQRATHDVLRRAGLAAEPLRLGLDPTTAARAAPYLHALIGGAGIGLADTDRLLILVRPGAHHRDQVEAAARKTVSTGRTAILRLRDLPCDIVDCPIRGAVVAPLASRIPAAGGNGAAGARAEVPGRRPGARGGDRIATRRRTFSRGADKMIAGGFLRVLAVDDEPPALDELAYVLRADPRVATVSTASDVAEAFRVLRDTDVDAVFLDIRMPGLDGMELARVLGRFASPPAVVFVTAYDDRAAEAFDMGVADYVRKPVQAERIAESLRRVLTSRLCRPTRR